MNEKQNRIHTQNFEQHRAALHLNVILDLFQLITNEKKRNKAKKPIEKKIIAITKIQKVLGITQTNEQPTTNPLAKQYDENFNQNHTPHSSNKFDKNVRLDETKTITTTTTRKHTHTYIHLDTQEMKKKHRKTICRNLYKYIV